MESGFGGDDVRAKAGRMTSKHNLNTRGALYLFIIFQNFDYVLELGLDRFNFKFKIRSKRINRKWPHLRGRGVTTTNFCNIRETRFEMHFF